MLVCPRVVPDLVMDWSVLTKRTGSDVEQDCDLMLLLVLLDDDCWIPVVRSGFYRHPV